MSHHEIAIADEVHVLNVGGYIGESTRREVQRAMQLRKRITFLEPDPNWPQFSEQMPPHRAVNCWCAQLPPSERAKHHVIVGVDPSSGDDWIAVYDHTGQQRINARAVDVGLPDILAALGVEQYTSPPAECADCRRVRATSHLVYCPEHDPATPRGTGEPVVERLQEPGQA